MVNCIAETVTDEYALYNSDFISLSGMLPNNSIDLSIYSPPFGTSTGALYSYSSSDEDLSNCKDYDQFFEHYTFMVEQIARVTKPGRLSAVHCIDTPSGNTGKDYLIDFPGDIIRLYKKFGFDYVCRYCVWKEPLAVRNRTMAKNLAHKTVVQDASKCSVASADYLLMFRLKGENQVPISNPVGLLTYAGSRKIPPHLFQYKGWTGNQIENRYSHWIWRQYASAFWDDVRINRVLPFQAARDQEDEKHVHPLQLDVIERIVQLWSNPGETVLTPCMGVGSEVFGAVKSGRRGIGIELKPSYYRQAVRNLDRVHDPETEQEALEFEVNPDEIDEEFDIEEFATA